MYIIPKLNKNVNQKGSSLLLPVSGWVGQGRLKDIMPSRQKNLRAKPKQAGKNWGSLRGEIFARPLRLGGGGSVSAFLRQQERKIEKFSFP